MKQIHAVLSAGLSPSGSGTSSMPLDLFNGIASSAVNGNAAQIKPPGQFVSQPPIANANVHTNGNGIAQTAAMGNGIGNRFSPRGTTVNGNGSTHQNGGIGTHSGAAVNGGNSTSPLNLAAQLSQQQNLAEALQQRTLLNGRAAGLGTATLDEVKRRRAAKSKYANSVPIAPTAGNVPLFQPAPTFSNEWLS